MSFILEKACGVVRSVTDLKIARSCVTGPNTDGYRPGRFERRFLVWTGKYNNMAEVPTFVCPSVMERTRSQMRIRTVNLMMAFTFIGTAIVMYSFKKQHNEGPSLQQQNLEWHRQYNEGKVDANRKPI